MMENLPEEMQQLKDKIYEHLNNILTHTKEIQSELEGILDSTWNDSQKERLNSASLSNKALVAEVEAFIDDRHNEFERLRANLEAEGLENTLQSMMVKLSDITAPKGIASMLPASFDLLDDDLKNYILSSHDRNEIVEIALEASDLLIDYTNVLLGDLSLFPVKGTDGRIRLLDITEIIGSNMKNYQCEICNYENRWKWQDIHIQVGTDKRKFLIIFQNTVFFEGSTRWTDASFEKMSPKMARKFLNDRPSLQERNPDGTTVFTVESAGVRIVASSFMILVVE